MKRTIFTALALTVAAAGAVSANTFDFGSQTLTVAQEAQIRNVLNSDESSNTQRRLIDAIIAGGHSSAETTTKAQVKFILGSDESEATKARLLNAVTN